MKKNKNPQNQAYQDLILSVADEIRERVEAVTGYTFALVKEDIRTLGRSLHRTQMQTFEEEVLSHLLVHNLIEVDGADNVIAPERPEALTKTLLDEMQEAEKAHQQDVDDRTGHLQSIKGWHRLEGAVNGFITVNGKRHRIDPYSHKVTVADKRKHGDVYFSEQKHRQRRYAEYMKQVGVEMAVHPYEWMIGGWFTDGELTSANLQVISMRENHAKLHRVDVHALFGDYMVKEET
jgi:hypothetical protein